MGEEKFVDTFTPRIKQAEVSIVLPAYNEADNIEYFVKEIYEKIGNDIPIEIVISEDGSQDGTKDVIMKLSREIPLKAILSPNRKGYIRGVLDGIMIASSPYVLITDSDGQHDPKDFWKLWEYKSKYDIITGWRRNRQDGIYRKLLSQNFQHIAKALFGLPKFHDIAAPFKLTKRDIAIEIIRECRYLREGFWIEFMIRAYKKGYKIKEVPVTHRKRRHGDTHFYKPSKLPKIALRQLVGLIQLKRELS